MNNESALFFFDIGAVEYIKKRTNSIVISFDLEPALGGCACSPTQLTGSFTPSISLGEPNDKDHFQVETVCGVSIFYPDKVGIKPDASRITIKLRKLLFTSWLEIEGMQSKSVFH
ncbi:MAG: CC/Se motif family (seleno)protein [Betaproteobacteria bacterium]